MKNSLMTLGMGAILALLTYNTNGSVPVALTIVAVAVVLAVVVALKKQPPLSFHGERGLR